MIGLQKILKVLTRYLKTSKFAIISSIFAVFAVIFISTIIIPSILITDNSTQDEISSFINTANILVLISNILLIYFILSIFFSLLIFLIKDSILHNDNTPGNTFLIMFIIIFLTILSFGYIYNFNDSFFSDYTDIIKKFDSITSKYPNVKLDNFNQNLINFIKNSDPEFNLIFKTQKEAINTFDYYFFSAVTFFSGNHTDITPNNIIVQIIVLLENISTFIITIVYIPIILNFIQVNKKEEKQAKNNNYSVSLRLQQGNTTLVYELKEVIED